MKGVSIRLPEQDRLWLSRQGNVSQAIRELINKARDKQEVEETVREVVERIAREVIGENRVQSMSATEQMQTKAQLELARLLGEKE